MISTRKKKQLIRRILYQLDETVGYIIFVITSTKIENTGKVDKVHEDVNPYNANHSVAKSGSQVDMQTLEKNISEKLRSEVESVVDTVETRVH